MVRFDLDPDLDDMKANWYHSKYKYELPYLFEHDSNDMPSFSLHRFVPYRISFQISS